MTPKQARESDVNSMLMQDSLAGITIAPTVSMTQQKETVNSLHGRASWLRRMEWALAALAALAVVEIVIDVVKRHF